MADQSYTSSERRGIIVIAVLALLITAAGITVSFCSRGAASPQEPVINVMPEMVDTMMLEKNRERKLNNGTSKKGRKGKTHKSSEKKSKKSYRKRSPLDEPV